MEKKVDALKEELRTDPNINRLKHYAHVGPKKLPSATKQYFLDKLPIVQWLPRYSPSWLVSDFSK
jgi:sodium-independent sulfate anion transporter 11